MRLRERRFQRRRRLSWWTRSTGGKRRKRLRCGLFSKVSTWWNRRRLYTFHKDEVFTSQKHTWTPPLMAQTKNYPSDEDEAEWNNDSESEDPQSDTASKYDVMEDKLSQADYSDLGEDDVLTLVTIEEESPLDDTLVTIEEEESFSEDDDSARLGSKPKVVPLPQKKPPPPPSRPLIPTPAKAFLGTGVDSISGSLESMDSLVSSQWDPEDDAYSNVTPLVSNIHPKVSDAFFVEHVRFLQIQTQPRKVEEVYHDGSKEEKPASEQ